MLFKNQQLKSETLIANSSGLVWVSLTDCMTLESPAYSTRPSKYPRLVVFLLFFKRVGWAICYNFSICFNWFLLLKLLSKIRLNIEIWKEDKERDHVTNQGILHPQGVVTLGAKWHNTMTQKNTELDLNTRKQELKISENVKI